MKKTIEYKDLPGEDVTHIVFWGHVDDERLRFDDLDETIEHHLDGWDKLPGPHSDLILPFAGYVRMPLPNPTINAEWLLESLLERLDEELADPDALEGTKPTTSMTAASVAFVEAVQSEYRGFPCEESLRVMVPVREWVEKHAPGWLEEREVESV